MAIRSDRLRRGFKSDAEAISREVRDEMGLTLVAPLDPIALAAHLNIDVIALSAFTAHPEIVRHFRGKGRRRFSAMTVFITDTERVILYNDFNSLARRASDITHECAHGLLLHEPRPAFTSGGCRDVDNVCEQEATWLGGTLLVPYEAAIAVARANLSVEAAAARYGVSASLMRWRLNKTGALKRVAALKRMWGR